MLDSASNENKVHFTTYEYASSGPSSYKCYHFGVQASSGALSQVYAIDFSASSAITSNVGIFAIDTSYTKIARPFYNSSATSVWSYHTYSLTLTGSTSPISGIQLGFASSSDNLIAFDFFDANNLGIVF